MTFHSNHCFKGVVLCKEGAITKIESNKFYDVNQQIKAILLDLEADNTLDPNSLTAEIYFVPKKRGEQFIGWYDYNTNGKFFEGHLV